MANIVYDIEVKVNDTEVEDVALFNGWTPDFSENQEEYVFSLIKDRIGFLFAVPGIKAINDSKEDEKKNAVNNEKENKKAKVKRK